jgi:hypothetical protein
MDFQKNKNQGSTRSLKHRVRQEAGQGINHELLNIGSLWILFFSHIQLY